MSGYGLQIIVGYWKIRGLAAPLRMICQYAGADYISKEYDVTVKEGGGYRLHRSIAYFVACG